MGEWREVRLGDLCDPSRGISYGVVQPGQHVCDGVPIVRVTDIRNGRINPSDPLRVSPEVVAKHKRTELQGGELLLTLVGTVGETAIVPEDLRGWNTARAVGVIPVLRDPGASWVRYSLQAGPARKYIDARLNTTVQATLNLGDLAELPIPMPSVAVRHQIAHILGTLDDKIELNRRTSETLEAMARALFKSWFVDFDPVRAKARGDQPAGMDDATAKLFPSELVDSELGPVPKGWRVARLGDVLELKRGYDLPTSQRVEGPIPIVSSSGPSGSHNDSKVAAPGIVTGRYGTIGKVYLVDEPFWPLNTTLYVRDFKGTRLLFAYHLLSGLDFNKFSDKGAVPGVNRNDLHQEPVLVAPAEAQAAFENLAQPWGRLSRILAAQNRALAAQRDTLLPKLLSGELSVREVA